MREHHGIPHDETVRMIRPPSEIRRKAIDNLIVEAANSESRNDIPGTSAASAIEQEKIINDAVEAPSVPAKQLAIEPNQDEEDEPAEPACPLCQNTFDDPEALAKHLKMTHSCSELTVQEAIAPYKKIAIKVKN